MSGEIVQGFNQRCANLSRNATTILNGTERIKGLVKKHGGSLALSSTCGGSCFTIILSLRGG